MGFKLALVYDSDKRYIIPFDIAVDALGLTNDSVDALEVAVLREVAKG